MQPELPVEIYPLIADQIRDRKTWQHLLLANSLVYDAIGFHGRIRARKRLPPAATHIHDCPHDFGCKTERAIMRDPTAVKMACKHQDIHGIVEAALTLVDRAPCDCTSRHPSMCPDCKYIFCKLCAYVSNG